MDVFSASVEMIVWFLTFIVLTGFIRSVDLGMSSPSCMPGIAPAWSWTCGWVQFAGIYWAFSHLCSLGYWPVVLLFLYCPLLASVLGYSWPYKISLGVFPPLWFLEQVLRRIGMNLWNVWLHSPAKPSGSFPCGEVSRSVRLLTRDCSARTFFLKRRGEVVSKLPVAFRLSGCWACRPSLAPLSDPVRKVSVVRSPFLRCHFVALSPRFLGYSS